MLVDIKASSFARHFENSKLENIGQDLVSLMSDTLNALDLSYRERIFTPYVTLYAFLSQIFNEDSSCRRAVLEVANIRKARRQRQCSTSTGSFCKAKKRLPLILIEKLVKQLAKLLTNDDEKSWRHGRVFVIDGTSFSMPDTDANAAIFIRPGLVVPGGKKVKKSSQRTTFPVGRILGIFSLKTGLLIDLAISTWKGKSTGETSLLQQLWSPFKANDTLLGDALYSSFLVIASAQSHCVHVVSELKTASCQRINRKLNDQIIKISKPYYHWNCSLSKEEYASLTNEITVRVVKLICAPAGFRPTVKFIITTHLDKNIVTHSDITDLYRQRWQIELNFRSIKTHLGMDVLASKSPDMVHKEVWVYMLGYNLIRQQMIIAGIRKQIPASYISFRAAQQALSIDRLLRACGIDLSEGELTSHLISEQVGKRPNRYEPRTIKRRGKPYKLMTESRAVAKTKLYKKSK